MTKRLIYLMFCLVSSSIVVAKKPQTVGDTITPDYNQAVNFCLFHQFAEAELLLKQIVRQPAHPNRDAARFLLLEDVYFWRGMYRQYVSFADSTGQPPPNYSCAKLMIDQPVVQILLSTDSTTVPFTLRSKGHVVVDIMINGKLRNFLVDTGAQRTMISTKLANELNVTHLLNIPIQNSLGQMLPSSLALLDSAQLGELHLANLPVVVQSLWGSGIDGLLGWDVLQHLCFTIDYQAKILVFRKPVLKSLATKNLLGGSRPLMAFYSQLGSQLHLFFDLGSNEKVSFSPFGLTRIGHYKLGRAFKYQHGVGGKVRFSRERKVKQANLKIEEQLFQLKNAVVNRSDEQISSVLIDGIVGSRQFMKGRLTIDYLNNHFGYSDYWNASTKR